MSNTYILHLNNPHPIFDHRSQDQSFEPAKHKTCFIVFFFQTWNDELAWHAGMWASVCYWGHGVTNHTISYGSIGQNLWLGGGEPSGVNAVIAWHDNEERFYDYDTKKCEPFRLCGHYTQVCTSIVST